jgi:hypothetical protein
MATSVGRSVADLQVAIADWLLHSNARIRTGAHAGGVAGWLDENDDPEFVYPEITGYYLSWIAFVVALSPDLESDARDAAVAAVNWVDRITSRSDPPATRYYFDDREDWRNNATFTFDLAMLCRGLHAVRRLVPEQPRKNVIRKLLRHLAPAGNVLPAVIHVRGPLPECWSTRPGAFQLKSAAALRPILDHPAVWGTFNRWSGRVLDGLDGSELHPAFYAVEGLIQFGISGKPKTLREAASCFEVLFECINGGRSDVVAQGLRLGTTLRSLGFLQNAIWKERLEELDFLLEGFVSRSGAVCFYPSASAPVHFNTWAAIFAHQHYLNSWKNRRTQNV